MGMKHKRHSRHVTRGPRWQALRLAVLRRDSFQCCQCAARGRLEIDHIEPVRTHPELAYAIDNLQALCPACHTRKTRIECGHAPPDPRREQWRAAVDDLANTTKPKRAKRKQDA